MLDSDDIFKCVRTCGVDFFTGVPDSLLKEFCACVTDQTEKSNHVIAANEGGSIGLAAGHYLATGKPALVYMQNSGLGNAVNPLLSLADPSVYAIPMLLMIGWRGEPDVQDEPQHVRQGELTIPMLEIMGVSYQVLPDDENAARQCIQRAYEEAVQESRPVAIIVRKGAFNIYDATQTANTGLGTMSREAALEQILDAVYPDDVVVATTGKTSREVFEIRENSISKSHQQDFLTVGSMGHCSQIALGLSLAKPDRKVWCLDGDGAALMHLGGMAIIGHSSPSNLVHVILNNAAHESVGGQPTVAGDVDLLGLADSLGYAHTMRCSQQDELSNILSTIGQCNGPVLLEVRVALGSRKDLGRPTSSPAENKDLFREFLK